MMDHTHEMTPEEEEEHQRKRRNITHQMLRNRNSFKATPSRKARRRMEQQSKRKNR